jgi:hypothetical protein
MLGDGPFVHDTGQARKVSGQGLFQVTDPFKLDLADEDPESLADRGIVKQAAFPFEMQGEQ